MSDPAEVLDFAKEGRWDELARILATVRHEPVLSAKHDFALKDLRAELDKGVMYYLLRMEEKGDEWERLVDILYAGANPFVAKINRRRWCFRLLGFEKHDPVHMAAMSGKVLCLRQLLKFDRLPTVKGKSARVKARTRTMNLADAAQYFYTSELLRNGLEKETQPLVKFAAGKEWMVVFNRLRRGCARFEDLVQLWEGKNVYEWALTFGNIALAHEIGFRYPFVLVELETRKQQLPYAPDPQPSQPETATIRNSVSVHPSESSMRGSSAGDDDVRVDAGGAGDASQDSSLVAAKTKENRKPHVVFSGKEDEMEDVSLSSDTDSPRVQVHNPPARV